MFKLVNFIYDGFWPFSDQIKVTILGQNEINYKEKIALIEFDIINEELFNDSVVKEVIEFPTGFLSCLGQNNEKYLNKAEIINWKYPINEQIKLLRKIQSGENEYLNKFEEFNNFCNLIP